MIKFTVTLKYRDETLVYFFSFIILFIWLFFFFPKQTFFSLFPCFWRKQTKRFERAKRDLDQAKNPTGPPGWKLFIYILFDVFENSETNKRGELIRQIPEGGETISFEFSTTSISLGEWRLSWHILMSHAYCLAHGPFKKKKKTVVNLFVCAYFDFIWVYLN